jgi:gas vesicle protein
VENLTRVSLFSAGISLFVQNKPIGAGFVLHFKNATMNKILTGILAGIAIGILLAPDKGTETRRKISERLRDAKDSVDDFISESRDTIESGYETVRDEASDLFQKGKNKFDTMKGKTEDTWNA